MVLMAVHNGERFLLEAIESVLNQTFSSLELLVVDDASTDSTADVIRSYSTRRLRTMRNEKTLGPGGARDRGLRDAEAEGECVAVLDADDVALPGRLAAQVAYLSKHTEGFAGMGIYYAANNSLGGGFQCPS